MILPIFEEEIHSIQYIEGIHEIPFYFYSFPNRRNTSLLYQMLHKHPDISYYLISNFKKRGKKGVENYAILVVMHDGIHGVYSLYR